MPLDQSVLESQDYKDAVASAITEATQNFRSDIDALKATNSNLKTEKQELAGQFSEFKTKFDGIDVEAMQKRLAEVDNDETRQLLAKGEYDKVFEKDKAKLSADHEAQISALNKEKAEAGELAQALERTLVSTVRDGGISQAFVGTEADKSQLRSVQAIAKDTVLVKGEWVPVVSVDKDGQSVFRHSTTGDILQNAEGNFGYQDWLKHLSEKEGLPLFAKPNSHSDPNARSESNPKGLVKSKMTDAEKQKFKKEHGIPAYNALPYS